MDSKDLQMLKGNIEGYKGLRGINTHLSEDKYLVMYFITYGAVL